MARPFYTHDFELTAGTAVIKGNLAFPENYQDMIDWDTAIIRLDGMDIDMKISDLNTLYNHFRSICRMYHNFGEIGLWKIEKKAN